MILRLATYALLIFLIISLVSLLEIEKRKNKLLREQIILLKDSVNYKELQEQYTELEQLKGQITDSINKLNALGKNAPIGSKEKADSFRKVFFTSKNKFHSNTIKYLKTK